MRTRSLRSAAQSLALASTFIVGLLGAPGCARPEDGSLEDISTGNVRVALVVAPNIVINTVSYEVTGNGFQRSGSINVTNSSRISTLVGSIPPGINYTVALSAVGSAGLTCAGVGTFSVTAGAMANATVQLQCRLPAQSGRVEINGVVNVCPTISDVSISPSDVTVSFPASLSAVATDIDHIPSALTYAWTTTLGTISNATSESATLICSSVGTASVTLTVRDGDCSDTVMATVTCSAAPGGLAGIGGSGGTSGVGGTGGTAGTGGTGGGAGVGGTGGSAGTPMIVINEVESNGGTPGDWVELFNAGTAAADLSGWIFRDNDDTHAYTIPAGTTVAPGAYFVLEEAAFGFGLGGNENARLFLPGNTLYEVYAWTAHAAITYGRCPNGTGAFVTQPIATKGTLNRCSGGSASAPLLWPGGDAVVTVDVLNSFSSNLSGLTYQPAAGSEPAVLWAVLNNPPTLYRLVFNGSNWVSDASNGWSAGKLLQYPGGTGAPDSEGVTKTTWSASQVYVSTERNNNASTVSRQAVLLFDSADAGTTLLAQREWVLTSDLPVVGANLGMEAITWVPDSFLTSRGFIDEHTGVTYNPASYGPHADGVFFIGIEGTGMIYGYVLNHSDGSFQRVATIASPFPGVMGMELDRDLGYLWSYCDDTCGNVAGVLEIEDDLTSANFGRFVTRLVVDQPTGLANINNEGFAIAPEAECVGGQKQVFWSDDNRTGGYALRQGSLLCGPLF